MKTFDYERASSIDAAVRAGGRFIAGGTNLLDLMKLQVETPDKLVDISRLDLDRIEERDDGGLTIGALVPNSDLAADPRVIERYEVLSRALLALLLGCALLGEGGAGHAGGEKKSGQ